MKYWWILVLLALILVVWGVRERFEATQSIKAPPYDAAEKVRIFDMVRQRSSKPPYTFLGYQDLLMAKAKAQAPTETNETKLKEIGGGLVSPAVESFFTSVYKPATTPIKQEDIDKFMETRTSDLKDVEKDVLTTYFIGQSGAGSSAYSALLADMGQSNFGYAQQGTGSTTGRGATSERASVGGAPPPMAVAQQEPTEDYADPICPAGTSLDMKKRCRYPEEAEMPTCPSGYVLTGGARCRKIGGTEEIDPQCPAGKVYDANDGQPGWGCIKAYATPTCPSGFSLRTADTGNTCFKPRAPPPANTTGGSTTTTGINATGGSTTGTNATGATGSGVTPANVRKNNVLGPVFTSYGAPIDGSPDSHKTNQYPELLGGGDAVSRRRQGGGGFGFGIDLKGSMPTADGLGATEQSKFFPFSRQPGDMELIPDPYRVSQQFSSASYSFKTEPTPFLTDFSAFLR